MAKIVRRKKTDIDYLKKDKLLKLGLAVIILLFGFVVYRIFDGFILKNDKVDLSGENYYQYFLGIMQEYSGKIDINEKNDQLQLVLEDGKVVYLDSTPIYYKDIIGKALFANEMELVIPDVGNYRLNKFTNIVTENNVRYVKKMNKDSKKAVTSGFIFDGSDLYFFLDETKLRVGKNEYNLSPLSYAIVSYRDSVEIYNYEKEEYIMIEDKEELQSDVIASNKYGDYNINLSVDSLSTNKSQQLLLSNIKNLKEFSY